MDESLKEKIIKLKKDGLTYSEISNELKCSKGTVSYHCKNNGLSSDFKIDENILKSMNEYYKFNTKNETAKKFNVSHSTVVKYCENKRVLLTDEEKNKKNREAVKKRRRELKAMAVDYKGGCCENCKYNNCIDALEFHHIDPTKKDFSISAKGITKSWEKVKKELDKCILVCANCHREIHADIKS